MAYQNSNIVSFDYDAFEKTLKVYFLGGGMYEYEGVPYDKYSAMLESKKKSEYFNNNIKSVYKNKKVY